MGFPAQTIWADSVTDLINDTPKHTFAGSKPFITLTKFIGPGANKLYYGYYILFNHFGNAQFYLCRR